MSVTYFIKSALLVMIIQKKLKYEPAELLCFMVRIVKSNNFSIHKSKKLKRLQRFALEMRYQLEFVNQFTSKKIEFELR